MDPVPRTDLVRVSIPTHVYKALPPIVADEICDLTLDPIDMGEEWVTLLIDINDLFWDAFMADLNYKATGQRPGPELAMSADPVLSDEVEPDSVVDATNACLQAEVEPIDLNTRFTIVQTLKVFPPAQVGHCNGCPRKGVDRGI